jgi:hypothetical protein
MALTSWTMPSTQAHYLDEKKLMYITDIEK